MVHRTASAAASADRHQHKKAFQPQITSFFHHQCIEDAAAARESARSPALAPSVQSSLLSVGMRIRKAVPEGYKTHKTSGLGIENEVRGTGRHTAQPRRESSGRAGRARELQPFCGLLNVGGLGVQDTMHDAMSGYGYGRGDMIAVDSMAELDAEWNSSQESNSSIAGDHGASAALSGAAASRTPHNKRQLEDDEDEQAAEDEQQVFTPLVNGSFPGRYFAKPRRSRPGVSTASSYTSFDGDFEEAVFLKPQDDAMQMGEF